MLEYWIDGMMGSKEKEESKMVPSDCPPIFHVRCGNGADKPP
jgi:hypothetical protein